MTGRHRKPRRLSKEGRRLLGGAALLAVFAPVTAYTLNAAIAHVQSCGTETTLTVAATPEMAPVLQQFIDEGGGTRQRGSDVCAQIVVNAVASNAIGEIEADVWIPETDLLLELPDSGLAEQWEVMDGSTASAPVGFALPEGADATEVSPETAEAELADPRQDAATLMWIVMFGVDESTFTDDPDVEEYPVMSGPQVTAYNRETGEVLQEPAGSVQIGQFEYPLLVASDIDDARREAASNLMRSYGSAEWGDLLTGAGFGYAVPEPPASSEGTVESVLTVWDSYVSGG